MSDVDLWVTDGAVLKYVMQVSAQMRRGQIGAHQVAQALELERDEVARSLDRLYAATPPFLEADEEAASYGDTVAPVRWVTERGLREVGAWPTAESLTARLIAGLDEAAERESDPESRRRLRETARYLAGAARDVVVDVAATFVARSAGM